ncbi:MAG: lysylphosphatidylglycerol synthase transmembrane domain-containing protein [Actinomycetota bacterium]
MSCPDPAGGESRQDEIALRPHVQAWRTMTGTALVVLALLFAAWAIQREWHSMLNSLRSMTAPTLLLSFACGILAIGATFPMWQALLQGLNVNLSFETGSRIFFVSQLGKYLPGSVWPIVMQIEAGRDRGATRRTMLTANLLAVALNSAVGLVVACVLLPFYDRAALAKYWWVFIIGAGLLGLVHPKVFPRFINGIMTRRGRQAPIPELHRGALLRATGWSFLCWIFLGLQLGILANVVSPHGVTTYFLATGAMSLAVCAGVLFIPAPAGAGIRDLVVVLVLSVAMKPSAALGLALITRVTLILVDLVLAGAAVGFSGWSRRCPTTLHPKSHHAQNKNSQQRQ